MTVERQLRYWGIGLFILILALWLLADALAPFLAGMALAYFLDPLADRLERRGFSRFAATAVILLISVLMVILAMALIIPTLFLQAQKLIEAAPGYLEQLATFLNNMGRRYAPETFTGDETVVDRGLNALRTHAQEWSVALLKQAWVGGLKLVDFLTIVVITPVVAVYLLYDWDRMVATISRWLPRDHAPEIRRIGRDIDDVLAGFVRGQITICLFLGAYYATGLTLVGLDFGLLVGLIAGLISFIPFLGSIIGLILSLALALAQFWGDWLSIGLVIAVFISGQFIEGNFLTPRLMGEHVGLHPVWLIFALSAFGALMGFTGLLIAVPAAAAIGVLARYGMERYLESGLYLGRGGVDDIAHEMSESTKEDPQQEIKE